MTSQNRWPEVIGLGLGCVIVAGALFILTGFVPWMAPDTPAYLDPGSLPQAWAKARHPAFGWLLAALPVGQAFERLPVIQVIFFFIAAGVLHFALRDYGLSLRAASSVTVSLLLSNVIILQHNAVHPELLASAFAVLAVAQIVRLARGRHFWLHTFIFSITLGLAYVLRPTFLPAIALFPVLYVLLARLAGAVAPLRKGFIVLIAGAVPFLANSAVRLQSVGDFNIVSFGGYQMSGMAGLMLTHDIADRLPDDLRATAHLIVDRRTEAEARGEVLATPINSQGKRSFVSAAIGYYDIYARTYDSVLRHVIETLRGDEGWVSFNRRMMRLSLATIIAAPDRYFAWAVGGTSRAVGRMLVTNAPFVLAAIGLIILYPLAIWRAAPAAANSGHLPDVDVLLCITVVYTLAASALMILVTFPASRYLDSAGLLLPALPIYKLLSLAHAIRTRGRD